MKKLSLTLLLLLLAACQKEPQVDTAQTVQLQSTTSSAMVTDPQQMQVDLSVQGYTSTLHKMDITFLGQTIPYTYSDGKIGNSRGYNWWVSKHFALKSDLPKEKVTLYLELLEMAYPHYVALFGMEPPNIERQRIAVVYGSSRDRVREAMLDDGFLRGVHKTAGGETMFYNRAGYNFPSHREHHQRYIVIHETMHAFHMALNGHSTWAPNWITEGLADSVAHHVYDAKQKQLTVMVFDRAPMNYIETGLKQYYSANKPTIEQINDDPALKRGLNFFIIHYLLSSPERAQYFAYFVQQLRLANPHSDATLSTANSLLKHTFKDWQAIEQGFADFVQTIKPSFHIVSGPWEQDGNAYWLRNTDSNTLSRLDINPTSNATHPVIDFPAPQPSALINLNNEHQVAALIKFEPAQLQRGEIGIAMQGKLSEQTQRYRATFMGNEQANDDQLLKLLIVDAERILISENNISGFNSVQVALTTELKAALTTHKELGLNITLDHNQLSVNLKANSGTKIITQVFIIPFSGDFTHLLNTQKISLLSKNNNHAITPYLFPHKDDDDYTFDKSHTQLPNPWLFEEYSLLSRLFKTCQQYGAQLVGCDEKLSKLMKKLPIKANHAAINSELIILLNRYKTLLGDNGFSVLSGISASVHYHQGEAFLRVVNPTNFNLTLTAKVSFNNSKGLLLNNQQLNQAIKPGIHNIALFKIPDTKTITIEQTLNWQGLNNISQLHASATPFNGVELSLTQSKGNNGHWLFKAHLSGPYSGRTKGVLTLTTTPFTQPEIIKTQQHNVEIAPYEQKIHVFELAPTKQSQLITVTALLDVDGEEIRLVNKIVMR
ncbi:MULTISPECIES: hypothetical protein [Pseudoalteromonas]|uniref:hypothetical protein n=1 Tax=Pseudoalteromonas TaxID=53246 RepID=UPI0007DB08AF|nr:MULTISPECIES: hypothetical protein [Pseudoalteromonas]NMR27520.1 hypothetical protein [Pseudoalteromonas sp. NEC-BIFX-2020_015]